MCEDNSAGPEGTWWSSVTQEVSCWVVGQLQKVMVKFTREHLVIINIHIINSSQQVRGLKKKKKERKN
jgi:hypothetical protein